MKITINTILFFTIALNSTINYGSTEKMYDKNNIEHYGDSFPFTKTEIKNVENKFIPNEFIPNNFVPIFIIPKERRSIYQESGFPFADEQVESITRKFDSQQLSRRQEQKARNISKNLSNQEARLIEDKKTIQILIDLHNKKIIDLDKMIRS